MFRGCYIIVGYFARAKHQRGQKQRTLVAAPWYVCPRRVLFPADAHPRGGPATGDVLEPARRARPRPLERRVGAGVPRAYARSAARPPWERDLQ